MRNVVSLSDVPQDLHLWLKAEAKRQSAEQGVKVKLYQVVVQALQRFRRDVDNCRNNGIPVNEVTLGFQLPGQAVPKQHPRDAYQYFLKDGRGPYTDVQSALVDVPDLAEEDRPKHNRWDRLSTGLKLEILRRPKTNTVEGVPSNAR